MSKGGEAQQLAVVGMACRLPGAPNLEAFWRLLVEGTVALEPLQPDRWDPATYADELPDGRAQSFLGGVLKDFRVDFAALHLPPLQTERLHRMEKVAVATMTEALRDAQARGAAWEGKRGQIFVAASTLAPDTLTDHGRRIRRYELAAPIREALDAVVPQQANDADEIVQQLFNVAAPPVDPDSLQSTASLIGGRVAHLFNFDGGHLAVDGGMSSSLAALHRAAVALQTGACDLALVCGLSPLLTASSVLAFAHHGLLTTDRPRPFQPDANGTTLGEGAGALVLMRRDEVPAERTYAVLEGLGSGHASSASALKDITAQAATAALAQAGCGPDEVAVVESRACGVAGEDSAESEGLAIAYGSASRAAPLLVTSTVGQLGFLQAAGGTVALLKACLAISRGSWPASAVAGAPRRVGVSDAGLGPLAYHAILAHPSVETVATEKRVVRRRPEPDAVAVVGAGLLVPQANDVETFWRNVLNKVDAISDLPADRFDVDRLVGASPDAGAVLKTRLAGVVDIPAYDPLRFGLPPHTAAAMDPAVALSLLSAEQALAQAQYGPGKWDPRRVQVVMGQLPMRAKEMQMEARLLFAGHLVLSAEALREAGLADGDVQRVIQLARELYNRRVPPISPEMLEARTGLTCAQRVANAWGFHGGALSVDAACASSLAAVRIGVESLRLGEADVVVAGGVAYNLLPEYYISLSMLGVLSPRGAPPFDVGADGFVPAEGGGAVVLRRLKDAQQAGEKVLAVIRGVGSAGDGRSPSIYAPSGEGYRRAIQRALQSAGVGASDIDYVEAHGGGTRRGDQAETEAYAAIYGQRDAGAPMVVGTVKSQIGHQSSAAGIVGLIKTALALERRVIPPSNCDAPPHAELPFGRVPLDLAAEPRPWTTSGRRRRAGVSAFGLGGVNYHVILEEPERNPRDEVTPEQQPPAHLPSRGARADRFLVELVPVALPERPPRLNLLGRHVVVVADAGKLWPAFQARLTQRGAVVSILPAGTPDLEAAIRDARAAHGVVHGVLDLSTFAPPSESPPTSDALARQVLEVQARAFTVLRAVYPDLADAAPQTAFYGAVTSMGGDLGLMVRTGGNVLGATMLGWAKGLKQELPGVVAKGLDFDPHQRADEVATQALREIEDANPRMEVGFAGRRFGVNLRRASFPEEAPAVSGITRGDVYVFSGGGRGVVFECACALARQGAIAVVTGRTAPPRGDESWLHLDEAAFAAYRTEEMARRRRADPTLTPARFAQEFDNLVRQRELFRNLQRARAQELPLHYEVCDVTDRAQVDALVARVVASHGRVDGLIHGAMVEWSRSLPSKSPQIVERTMAAKVVGLIQLVEALREEKLGTILCFGSGAGRFGNRGQSDYCAANAQMAALLPVLAARHPARPRAMTVDWTAWQEVGAAVQNPDVARLVEATGVTAIRPQEGTYWFLRELTAADEGESVIFEERMLHDWPTLGSGGEGSGEDAVLLDDRGMPLVPGEWPLVDRVLQREEGRVRFARRLEVDKDAFLDQHRLYRVPIVPATFGCEILAEAAALCSPGWDVAEAHDVVIDVPMKLFREQPLLIRASATVVEESGDVRVVQAETHSHLFLKGRPLEERTHHRGRFLLRRQRQPASKVAFPDVPGVVRSRSFFHLAKDPVTLGPLFCRAEWIRVTVDSVVGTVRAPRQRDILARTAYPVFQVDPLLMDAAFQVAANWDGHHHGNVSIPVGVGKLLFGRTRGRGEAARVLATVRQVANPDVVYDIMVAGENDDLLMQIGGLRLRRVSPADDPSEA
ncbi:MAG: SDR family NAD(P)-dependent oxidoreductase [Myxococcota bacterium]